jgi:hypothetical protein
VTFNGGGCTNSATAKAIFRQCRHDLRGKSENGDESDDDEWTIFRFCYGGVGSIFGIVKSGV